MVSKLIDDAFSRLSERPGFVDRPDQRQLALLISDCIGGAGSGIFEAPTGLGKSLAALIPAIAYGIKERKRVVISTYTNVLAEQYWRSDLPLALSLFDEPHPRTQFLIGRQRYACQATLNETASEISRPFRANAELGIESEFRSALGKRGRDLQTIWQQVSAPPVCPARLCPEYHRCYYYRARRGAEKAEIVITNHSVVMQDAILRNFSNDRLSLLGEYDFLIVDEAHDLAGAAESALEFELSEERLGILIGIANRMEQTILPIAAECGNAGKWAESCETFRVGLGSCIEQLKIYGLMLQKTGILTAAPTEVWDHPNIRSMASEENKESAKKVATLVVEKTKELLSRTDQLLKEMRGSSEADAESSRETLQNYLLFIQEFGERCSKLFSPLGISVSYATRNLQDVTIRQDVIGVAEPLKEMLWSKKPSVCMSATLALDGEFSFFKRQCGAEATFEETLPSPFDFRTQAALYLPQDGAIFNPTEARKGGFEEQYFDAVATELQKIILAMRGRTLALFHSRREMEAVAERMQLPDEFPVLLQRRSGAATVGEKFKDEPQSSLFALRSFWTGFDAPGETLSCVVIVRVPFEVPVEPPQVARGAWMESQGLNPFFDYSLQLSKMLMRQGAGRLIRRAEDRGLLAILDPRILQKRYGEAIIANLPGGMRTFRDALDAVAWLGLG